MSLQNPLLTIVSIFQKNTHRHWQKTDINFMSLNNIELKEPLITELYRGNLLATEGYTRTPATASGKASSPNVPEQGPAAPAAPALAPPAPPAPSVAVSPIPAAIPPAVPTLTSVAPAARPATAPVAPANTAPAVYKYLGNNRRHITIVVQSPGIAFLPDDQLNFLGKMLEACKMNMGDVAIVNHATHPTQIAALKQQLQPAFLLLFGLGPVDIKLPMNFPVFTIHNYDQCTYLSSPSLDQLLLPGDEGKLLKSRLWVSLKNLFEI